MEFAQKVINNLLQKHTQKELAEILGDYQANISAYKNGNRPVPTTIKVKISELFNYDLQKLLKKEESPLDEPYTPKPKTDKKADALDQLKKVTNGKNIEKKDNHIFHTLEAYVLPVKGRLGLGSTYYADSYFEDKLEKTTISVTEKPTNANRIILAEFEGESMTDGSPEQIPDGSWVILAERKRGEDWDANMEGKIMGFFDKDDNFTIKKVKKHDKHFKYVILEALNPDKSIPDNQDRELEIKNCWAIYDYLNKLS